MRAMACFWFASTWVVILRFKITLLLSPVVKVPQCKFSCSSLSTFRSALQALTDILLVSTFVFPFLVMDPSLLKSPGKSIKVQHSQNWLPMPMLYLTNALPRSRKTMTLLHPTLIKFPNRVFLMLLFDFETNADFTCTKKSSELCSILYFMKALECYRYFASSQCT